MSSFFFFTTSTMTISSSSRDSMESVSTISSTIASPSPVNTPPSLQLELDIVHYGLMGSTGFFLCFTLILMIVVVFLGLKIRAYKKRSGTDTMPGRKGIASSTKNWCR